MKTSWISRLVLVGLVALLLVLPAQAQQDLPIYIVQPGDTLSGIAQKFGTSVEALAQVNGITDPSALLPGTELRIPGFEGVSGVLTTRPTVYGESLESLSLRHGVGRDTLVRLNRIVNPERLYLGQEVILPLDGQGAGAVPEGWLIPVGDGEGPLQMAVRLGVSPWALTAHEEPALWLPPGAQVPLAEAGRPLTALPEPLLSVEVEPLVAVQGHTLVVRAGLTEPARLEGQFGDWRLNFVPLDEIDWVALQGVHAMAEPGLYDLEVRLLDEAGETAFAFRQPVRLRAGGYGFDPVLMVPPETVDPANTEPEDALVASILSQVTPERLWEGPFRFPTDFYTESFPSVFGTRRNYNGLGYNWYHSGLDFYGGTGVPILAPARGRVAFAGPLTVRGNTTILDHGWGVFTVYMHQSEILVSEGEMVEAGQTIGLVGATGRVTGPHLHWEVVVGGVPVDPLEWVNRTFP